ncbi:UbiX family flavin prenyltransferase [Asticcacaulis sp. AND118]|uniref:UbiX family flavin prenyltransferase n=1 Tax=Asticcacaulis sp. AND118 TaxID=2840468 RepID=UPI001CFFE5D6|nr:UbiX family flavin prenyltransferase [Asticcacaulis sp. AND118]UDF02868.1 UbiX family flavin prenyltransferase [Asticcacaulis sp. AND118]
MAEANQRLIVAISGASGAVYGITALRMLRDLGIETHLVVSRAAALSLSAETDFTISDLNAMADQVHKVADIGATIASGSFRTLGMLVAPCSIKTMSEIATGVTSNLISRAADVVLKERRRLVLMVRESPLHLGHLRTMTAVTEMGAVVAPPVPAFYTRPQTLQDMVDQSVARALDLFGLDAPMTRWTGLRDE